MKKMAALLPTTAKNRKKFKYPAGLQQNIGTSQGEDFP